jgi:4-hydroxy-4-methyl-2-oxoglutarate aldolase
MRPTVVKKIQRADPKVIATLGEHGVATVHEAQGRTGLMKPYMRPIYASARAAGSAVTVSCHPGDNIMIHAALEFVQPGDILVVTTTSESTDGMFGDLLGVSCQANGVVGLIIEAGVRDVTDTSMFRFSVQAPSSIPATSSLPIWTGLLLCRVSKQLKLRGSAPSESPRNKNLANGFEIRSSE